MKNFRTWGKPPYKVAIVHGGPGAPGSIAPVTRELSKDMPVLEPLQTKSSIDGQIAELADVLKKNAEIPVVLVGHSWGATLSYMTAARYPQLIDKLVLIGIPPLMLKDRPDLTATWLDRLSEKERVEFIALEKLVWDGDLANKSEPMGRLFRLITKAECCEMLPGKDEVLEYQVKANVFIFRELYKITEGTQLVELGRKILCPVTVIYGDYDPRPAAAVKEPLSRVIENFKFIMLEKCGHYPWLEKYARDEFFKILREEIK